MKHTKQFEEFINEEKSLSKSHNFIDESKIGEIHIMAQESDSFTAFRKAFMDEYGKPKSVKELKELEAWLQTIYREKEANESFVNEANVEYISKDDKHAKIAVFNEKSYVSLSQMNWDDNEKITFIVSKDQIDELCKILQKMK